jgi:hypothetical protein
MENFLQRAHFKFAQCLKAGEVINPENIKSSQIGQQIKLMVQGKTFLHRHKTSKDNQADCYDRTKDKKLA